MVESIAPRYIRDCIQLTVTPTDGDSLKASLHSRGINIRYLGYIAQIAAKRGDLRHILVKEGGRREGEGEGEGERERERRKGRVGEGNSCMDK